MTEHSPTPSPDTIVAEILTRWPASTATFVRLGMACPGCVMAPMMTLEEAAAAYELDVFELIADIVGARVAAVRAE